MEETEKIALAKSWVQHLANGINPIDGSELKDDDIVNNVHISRCLFYVADILGKYSERRTKSNVSRHEKFDSSVIQLDNYIYSDAITISEFARKVKILIPETMKVVSYKSMVSWLMHKGFIEEVRSENDGRIMKVATEKGNSVGIFTDKRDRNGSPYAIIIYNPDAQKYLLEHLSEMSNF